MAVKLPMLRTRVSLTNLSVVMVSSSNGRHPSPQSFLISFSGTLIFGFKLFFSSREFCLISRSGEILSNDTEFLFRSSGHGL